MKLQFNLYTVLSFALALAVTLLFVNGMHTEAFLIAPGAAALPEIEALATEFKTKSQELVGLTNDLKEAHKELKAKTENGEKDFDKLKNTVDEMLSKFNEQKTAFTELEQKMVEKTQEQMSTKTWGGQVVESQGFSDFKSKGTGRGSFAAEVKQVNSAAAAGLIRSQRENDVVGLPQERRVVRDLLTVIKATSSSIDFARQKTRTNNAAPVAEAAAKPYSDYEWESATVNVRTLAHLAKITRQAMDDAPRLMGEIDQEMRYGLGYVEERQFLYGTGIGQNLHGIIPQATAFAKPVGFVDAMGTRIDVLRLAILQTVLSLFPADGIVLSDTDWAIIELTKTEDGAYLFSNPQGAVGARLWNLPVVTTPAMATDDFLVGSFKMGATVYDRLAVEVLISTENDKDFENNLATMRAEERVAMAVKRANAFITGDFTSAVADIVA